MVARVGMNRDLAKAVPIFRQEPAGTGRNRQEPVGMEIARAKIVPTFFEIKKSL